MADGSAYEGRADLGNTQAGDGERFKGRGPVQLTGRANYAKASEALGVDFVGSPELVADPQYGFHAWRKRPESQRAIEDRRLAVLVREAHETGRKVYGSPRVHEELKAQGLRLSRKRVIRLMQEQGLKGKTRRRWVRTTHSKHGLPVAPNLLARKFEASGPDQRWVTDITYLRTGEGWLFLAVVLDLYSRMVVGWAVSALIDRHLVLKALDMALKRRGPGPGLLHHSDRDSQYASEDYQKVLEARGITCSMSRKGNCHDNAAMESWFGTLKTELGETFETHAEGRRKLFDYIELFYNQKRRHSTLGYVSPAEFERRSPGASKVVA